MKSFFFSDLHLGLPTPEISRDREERLCRLLTKIRDEVSDLWFLGDIFDFWWEYKSVVPAGYTRFFSKILEFTQNNIPVYFFTGNHDIWMKSYLETELNVKIIHSPLETELQGKKLYLAHGDGLGPGDYTYKFLKKIFTNKPLQWMFTRLHPNFAFYIARSWSQSRRKKEKYPKFLSINKELLFLHAKKISESKYFDYFVFGHRHLPMKIKINSNTTLVNTGEWLNLDTFACLNKGEMQLLQYKNEQIIEYPYPNPEKNPFLNPNTK